MLWPRTFPIMIINGNVRGIIWGMRLDSWIWSGIWRHRRAPRRKLQMVMVASLTCRTTGAYQATKRRVLSDVLPSG